MPADDSDQTPIRKATRGDAADVARLLHDFQEEFDEPSPGTDALSERYEDLIDEGKTGEAEGSVHR